MLKKFILNSLSSFVGAWIAILIFIIGLVIFIMGIMGSFLSDNVKPLTSHSVLKIVLQGNIEEYESVPELDYRMLVAGKIEHPQSLKTLIKSIDLAKLSGDIDALLIECQGAVAAPATFDALRNAVLDFKSSGKRVFAYGDNFTMGDYFVATAADVVYLNPAGSLDLQGLSGTALYYKDLLDKVGIDVQVAKVGTFKSAVEPFISNEMSDPARMQLDTLYAEMWTYILDDISEKRSVPAASIDSLVNNFVFLNDAEFVKNNKLVDECLYYRQVVDLIGEYIGKKPDEINFVAPETMIAPVMENVMEKNQIAVVYAVGDIGEYAGAGINCHELVPLIVSLAENEDIKGMVLRVNSPGGSVFGSEQIGEVLDYFKSKGKPLAVSMGDYAASGGYWISANADIIYADPLTITGSIGIFGLVPNVNKLTEKIGVHPQTVSTNPGVQFPSIFYPMSDRQLDALQKNVERGYEKFVSRVASGRHKSVEYVKSIAEGRVWNAIQAQKLGLVDELGGLNNAVSWVASKAGVSASNVVSYPTPEFSIINLLSSTSLADNAEVKAVLENMTSKPFDQKLIDFVGWFLMQNHIQARSPYYTISFN